jgi:3-deoxy-D-manno-octulosonic-acid transferase
VYGKPVIFGPEYEKFNEATELIEAGGATSITNALELEAVLNRLINNTTDYTNMAAASRLYVYSNRGSTEKILGFIQEKRLLTN